MTGTDRRKGVILPLLLALGVLTPVPPLASDASAAGAPQVTVGDDPLQSRNDPVRVAEGAVVTRLVETRNGAIAIGDRARVRGITTRGGRIVLGEEVTAGAIDSRNGAVSVGGWSEIGSVATRNGHVRIGRQVTVDGRVETRNARVELAEAVSVARFIRTRNGRIDLGDAVRVGGFVESRNGRILLGRDGHIGGDVHSRNGRVTLGPGALVSGEVRTRNGTVHLDGARVARSVDVYGADIRLEAGSEVEGDLIVLMPEDRRRWFGIGGSTIRREPVIRIDADARIGGRLIVDERARLEIQGGADVPQPEFYPSREAWGGR